MNDFTLSLIPGAGILETVYVIARALIIALDLLLVVGFIYAIKKAWKFRPKFDLGKEPRKKLINLRNAYYKTKWQTIVKHVEGSPTPESYQYAIVQADKLIDQLLKDLKFPGEHLADRLGYLNGGGIKSLDGVWDAHRIRNDIAHSPSLTLSVREGQAALNKYEAFFRELQIF
jgi:hypothetical protein